MTTDKVMNDDKRVEKAAYVLKAVAHPLRIKIIQMLNENKELNVSTIYKNLHAEQSLISHHLINMRDKGILDIRRSGKNIYYFLVDTTVSEIIECIYKSKILNG
ncbi:ArsR/SmtB family transcription factor [Spirosoma utsteinense]|uniref:DNA-binding transcriptional ArsR family regulator n=1 Tax=Spirosoma utsteinense TaxID=2585773 RepID=A0ABR6W0L9_9BACT|nr:metalloregulator ArsR/SmtB family transcription factor [Spirosoma utsteinense]MBC3783695.1 DNA-binding transcriptional ArsR family regulator [Spirosoma utsteinense]MBC3790162.1 DNA-binding transcriptional ArsR family regulator [Spirosoma utsteinense]